MYVCMYVYIYIYLNPWGIWPNHDTDFLLHIQATFIFWT